MKDVLKMAAFVALLLGGYIAYDQWRAHHECVVLARRFKGNMDEMMGRLPGVAREAQREGIQMPVLSLSGRVEENRQVMNQLDAQCPGWHADILD